jgi:hypothetical protein
LQELQQAIKDITANLEPEMLTNVFDNFKDFTRLIKK